MKRYIVMLMIVLLCTYTLYADAEEGSVEIKVPDGEEMGFTYSKVADIVDGDFVLKEEYRNSGVNLNQLNNAKETEEAIRKLKKFSSEDKRIQTTEGKAEILNLEEGVYLIEGLQNDSCQVSAVLVSIPTWDEETKEVSYDISVEPKMEKISESVQTGDSSNVMIFSVFFVISLIIVAILSCQKHFKCGRISE